MMMGFYALRENTREKRDAPLLESDRIQLTRRRVGDGRAHCKRQLQRSRPGTAHWQGRAIMRADIFGAFIT